MRLKLSYLTLAAALMAFMPLHAQHAQVVTTLDALRDQKRVLLVFAGSHDSRVEQQWNSLVEHRAQAAERDLLTVRLSRSLIKMHDGNSPPEAVFSEDEQQAVRARFHIAKDEFAVILIGKDGGEKLRSRQAIAWETLQATIDAMPMRQAEVRHSH